MRSIRKRTWLIPVVAGALASAALIIPATAGQTTVTPTAIGVPATATPTAAPAPAATAVPVPHPPTTTSGTARAAATTAPALTFPATADATVAEATPGTAEGTADRKDCFVNDDTGTRQECLLAFTVTGLVAGDTVTAATVLVNDKGDATGAKPVDLATVPTSWAESTVTWNTRPALGATVASQAHHAFGQDSPFAMPGSTITGNGTYAFALWSPVNSYPARMNFQPKDNTAGKPGPRLVLTVTHQAPTATARFPGDPGPGKVWLGLNDVPAYAAVQSHLPAPLGIRRVYNGNNWGVPKKAVANAIANHEIPFASWKLAPYTVSTVPQSAIDTVCADLKSFAPHPIWATVYHEPEDNLTTAAQAADYRALFRNTVHTCDAMGVTNVAWTEPTLQAPFSFGTASGRNPAWWEPDWKGTNTGTAADWYTGADRVIDILSIDVYIPLINTDKWQLLSTTIATVKNRWTALGMPLAGRPWAVGELGVKSDVQDSDLTKGPSAMQDAYDTAVSNGFVGIGWWTTGGDSFCDGPVPASDPNCLREQKLAALDGDPRTAHP
ncbi:MAG TPA: DNRLRE domain-containing protein [Pseudonocardiaceae bacterium]|nr:DNRLRE domain-containing protein [Pseudonocardiaceae bacterium]